MVRHFDIVMVTDARLPGGTSASVAEEVRAQAAAGFRTGLLQIDSPLVRRQRPISPRLRACLDRGEMELLLGTEPVEADLVLLRHPTVARSIDPAAVPPIRAAQRVLVVNQAPGTPGGPDETDDQGLRYDPAEVDQHVAEWLGGPVDWVPIGPLVRRDLAAVAPDLAQLSDDWVNVIDVAAWRQLRQGAMYRVPVIGRHSRDDPMKWPATREEVLRVYPDRRDVEVQVLGGAPRIQELFGGRLPPNWVVHPFGSMPPERFLAGIDIYVYYHHPALVEAFGRTIMEALASGAPTILPPHFRELFEDAALYAEPDDVLEHVRVLHRDRARYRDAAHRASTFVEERFGHPTHVRRVAALAEPSGTERRHVTGAGRPPASTDAPQPRRVLFVSSNGAGVGHLMRLMALARHAPPDVQPIFLTFSQGAKVVDDMGHFVEYLASRPISGATAAAWHPMLRERVNEILDRYDVRAMVFDGTWPYQGLLDAATDHPGVGLVWSRRAMWKRDVSNPILENETSRFDLILEPGEFAADEDHGPTRRRRAEAVRLGPVSYLGLEELLEPAEARRELELDPDRPAALVNLGAGNINDVSSLLGMVVDRLAKEVDVQVCVTRSIIADRAAVLPDNVRTISVYPLARYLRGFDFAFAASGYNSYHELVMAGVPTAFVPNVDTATDDQAARSRFAHRVGVGLDLLHPTFEAVDSAVATLMDPDIRRRMHERAVARRIDNGASRGMSAITDLVDEGVRDRPGPSTPWFERDQRPSPPSGATSGSRGVDPSVEPAPAVPPVTPDPGAPAASKDPAAMPESDATSGSIPPPGSTSDEGRTTAPASVPVAAPAAPQARPSRPTPGSSGPRHRVVLRRVLRLVRPWVRRLQADGPGRGVLKRVFWMLPASVRIRIRRATRMVEPVRPKPVEPVSSALPVPPGNVLSDGQDLKLPGIAFVLPTNADTATVAAIVDHIAQLQAASRAFAPLIITGDIDFRPIRSYGYLFEYLPGPDRWERTAAADSWLEARQRRIASIVRAFGLATVVTLPEPDERGLEGLRSLMSGVVTGVTRSA